ncbi:MAG: PEP-CTERM sorting domain-containing protein [Hormoscilla sp.]
MKKITTIGIGTMAIALGAATARPAAAIIVNPDGSRVLTFEDITTNHYGVIPDGYRRLNWYNIHVTKGSKEPGSGYDNGTVSGDYVAYTPWVQVGSNSRYLMDFKGVYLTAAWNDGLNIKVEGLLDGELKYSQTVVVDTDEPTWFEFNFEHIDYLKFTSFGGMQADGLEGNGTQFVMDNFTYTSLPEPGSVLGLVTLGALGAGSALKRKQKHKHRGDREK